MKKLLNTLYVNTQGAWLHRERENVVLKLEGEELARLPMHLLDGVVCIGRILVSPWLLQACAKRGITLTHLDENGRFLARVEGETSGNVLLRRAQYGVYETQRNPPAIARNIVSAKIHNQRLLLQRTLRDHGSKVDKRSLERTVKRLRHTIDRAQETEDLDKLRGLEGDAARAYFEMFGSLLVRAEDGFEFVKRTRRPPRDPVNALLSFLYTLLVHDCRSAAESVGLDPQVGYLHELRPGRSSLALDLAEDLRAPLCDRLALSLLNRRQLRPGDFKNLEGGAVHLTEDGRKIVLTAYQTRKQSDITHAFLGEKISFGLVPMIQAQLLARHLRGDLESYPPFVWR